MITFEEYLKGVETTTTINEEQEFLEEAYTPEMKKVFTSAELSEIGKFFADNHLLSVQDSDFVALPKNWKKSTLVKYEFCILKSENGNFVITTKNGLGGTYHYDIYNSYDKRSHNHVFETGDNKHYPIAFGLKPSVKAFGISIIQKERAKNKVITDKLDAVQDKVKTLSPTSTYGKMKSLCEKYDFHLNKAYIKNETPHVQIGIFKWSEAFSADILYKDNKWLISVYTPSKDLSLDSVVNTLSKFESISKFYADLKKLDISDLPPKEAFSS